MVKLSSNNFFEFTFNEGAARIGQTLEFDANDQNKGSAFFSEQIRFDEDTSFETNFRYQVGQNTGLTFILHDDPREDIAVATHSFDSGVGILSSVAVELDSLQGILINTNGSPIPLVSVQPDDLDLERDEEINVWIEYKSKNDRLKVFTSTTTTKPKNPLLSTKVDIEGIIGNKAYVGFGGYDYRNSLALLEWEFSSSDPGPNRTMNGDNENNRLRGTNQAERINGGNGNDTLIGRGGADELFGGAGNDTLTGGGGADDFLIGSNRAYRREDLGVDTITDFRPNVDNIVLNTDTFITLGSEVGKGFSIEREFASVKNKKAVAGSVADIVYVRSTGDLYYNANGALPGLGGGNKIATLKGAPSISAEDFILDEFS
ncbi:hypothetical protein [Okeania sp.]|uniref:hypothetical protein n=1 Tax=Okeania sp. TaxID=3100323 RepID=UPI002B4B3C40|nr:hypothetical protein [Okeania sp.]MEB3343765.1 hypothetical protein [Okeania sp.]